jgi:hypothetical protein
LRWKFQRKHKFSNLDIDPQLVTFAIHMPHD